MSETQEQTKPARSRASREQIETQRRARRRRISENDDGLDFNFWIDNSKLDFATFQYRWVNDVNNRVAKLIERDWDPVDESVVGFNTDRHADVTVGDARRVDLRARLMCKYKDWYDDDMARKQKLNDDRMQRVQDAKETLAERGEGARVGLQEADAYKPNVANSGFVR